GLRFMRDPTRGGFATVANEITRMTGLGLRLDEAAIPVSDPVAGVCELLGYDPLYLACEGRIVAIVAADEAGHARDLLESSGAAPAPTIVGTVEDAPAGVILQTTLGGERMLDELEDDPLPRIC
ncbi:MAG TPA: AIR synthase-related protein, partial [Gammaproteobacteria bacterium]|nr:AIR synthase-related protein [Gammaproteobacteria bacterium]